MKTIQTTENLHRLLSSIEMLGTKFEEWSFDWKVTHVEVPRETLDGEILGSMLEGWHIQCSFERPDANTGDVGKGYGRKWYVELGTPKTAVVFTAWMAIQQIVIHELHESFTVMVDGERVRLLDPHKELADLAVGSRRV